MVDEFSFETLSKQDALERKQPRLTKLEPEFWDHLRRYLTTLETGLRTEQARNPTSRKIALLQDELRNATRKSESLWETREKKITLHAMKNARSQLPSPPENALKSELALYEQLLQTFRQHVPDVVRWLEKSEGAPQPVVVPVMPGPAPQSAPTPAPAPVVPAAPAPAAPTKPADEQLTVRALVDVPPFVGLDGKTYRLKKGDVLTLPRRMVDVLAKRGQVSVMS